MIRTVQRQPIPVIQPRPTSLSGLGCGCDQAAAVRPSRGMGSITDTLQNLDWHVWLLLAAVAYILIQTVFFSDAKKAKRKKLREARESFNKRVAAIRAGKGSE